MPFPFSLSLLYSPHTVRYTAVYTSVLPFMTGPPLSLPAPLAHYPYTQQNQIRQLADKVAPQAIADEHVKYVFQQCKGKRRGCVLTFLYPNRTKRRVKLRRCPIK